MSVLQDPVQQLLGFAGLVEQAGLTAELSEPEAELTLFVPSNEVRLLRHCLGGLGSGSRWQLLCQTGSVVSREFI
jgi:hypothetical protein